MYMQRAALHVHATALCSTPVHQQSTLYRAALLAAVLKGVWCNAYQPPVQAHLIILAC